MGFSIELSIEVNEQDKHCLVEGFVVEADEISKGGYVVESVYVIEDKHEDISKQLNDQDFYNSVLDSVVEYFYELKDK